MKIPSSNFTKNTYLNPSFLEERGIDSVILTITKGEMKRIRREKKVIVHFSEEEFPPLIANKTQTRALVTLFGDETDDWVAQKILMQLGDSYNPSKKEPCKTIVIRKAE